jgi:eukaryotic-like serine/threonine-protein kinase
MEIRKVLPVLLLVCSLLAGCGASPAQNSAPAVMFLGGPEHNNISQSEPLRAEPSVKWKFTTGGMVRSSPIIAGNLLYVGSHDGSLYALNVETGAKKWEFKTGGPVASTPAVAGGLVYFTSGDGNLYALDAAAGTKKWVFPYVEGYGDIYDLFTSSPVVVDGIIYFGSGDAKIFAVDATTGEQVWVYETVKYDPESIDYSISIHASPAVAQGMLYAGDFSGNFVALDAKTGQLIWKDNILTASSSPAIVEDVVYYAGRNGRVTAADAKTGKKIWSSVYFGAWIFSSFALKDGVIHTSNIDGVLYALDAKTGEMVWNAYQMALIVSSPVVAGDLVFVGDSPGITEGAPNGIGKGKLYALDHKTGQEVWKFEAGGNIASTPLILNSVLYFGCDDGNVYALK